MFSVYYITFTAAACCFSSAMFLLLLCQCMQILLKLVWKYLILTTAFIGYLFIGYFVRYKILLKFLLILTSVFTLEVTQRYLLLPRMKGEWRKLCYLEALPLSFSSVYSDGEMCFFLTLEVFREQPLLLFCGWFLDECAGVQSTLLTFINL